MTYPISDVTRRVVYSGSLGTGPYPFTFEILTTSDIGVYKNTTLLTLSADYTVTINADGTGSVTLTSAATSTDTISIFGNKGIQRQTDFTTGGDLFANSLNDELDAQTIFAQQNAEAIVRAIRAPQFDPTNLDMTLPSASDRADTVLTFDTNGEPLATPTDDFVAGLSGAILGANYVTNTAVGDGSTVNFTVSVAPGAKGNIQIYIDGVYQNKSSFSISGTTITFTEAPPLNASVEFIIGYSIGSVGNDAGDITFTQAGTGAQTRTVESKLQDVVSVKDFGAVGDGVTDNTIAINNAAAYALATGQGLYFPAGTYLVSNKLTIGVPIYGEKSLIVSSDWYGSTQYNTSSMWGSGSIIVWDKSTLSTSDIYIVPPTSSSEKFKANNLTFVSKSNAGDGGGILIQRTDGGSADSFAVIEMDDCNIGNFATGINLTACSEGNYTGIQFRGCRTAIFAGASVAVPLGAVTYTTFTGCQIEGCGSQNSTYPCVDLSATQNIGFRDCVFQGTSDIRLTKARGTTLFDHCWMEAQSATENLLFKAVSGGTIQAVVLQNCFAGAGTIGDIDWSANTTGGDLIMFNSKMSGMNITMNGTNQFLLSVGSNDYGTRTNVITNLLTTSGGLNYESGSISLSNGQTTLFSSEASTKQLTIGSTTTSPKIRAGMQNGGAGNGFITSNYYFQSGDQTDDATKGLVAVYLNSTASTPTIGFGVSTAGSASPTTRTSISTTAYYPNQDNTMKLGDASNRWSEVYAAVGTINTSDERSKQDISELDDAEKRVALAIKGLVKKFKFKDAVAKKGSTARIHVGVIAQEVKAAFEAEGLDANSYGIFCYDEWDEIPEIRTEDGYVTQEYRPAGNAYGVRYEELLAFIIAAM